MSFGEFFLSEWINFNDNIVHMFAKTDLKSDQVSFVDSTTFVKTKVANKVEYIGNEGVLEDITVIMRNGILTEPGRNIFTNSAPDYTWRAIRVTYLIASGIRLRFVKFYTTTVTGRGGRVVFYDLQGTARDTPFVTDTAGWVTVNIPRFFENVHLSKWEIYCDQPSTAPLTITEVDEQGVFDTPTLEGKSLSMNMRFVDNVTAVIREPGGPGKPPIIEL